MRSSDHITLLRGGHEEYLEEITDAWPHVLEYVELDRYPHRSCTWHWHQEVELFYVKRGSLEYQTLRGCESFGAGSAGFVNAGVYHTTRATSEGEGTIQLCHIFRPSLIGDAGGRISERYVRPLVEARGVEILSWSPDSPEDARALELIQRSCELSPEDDAAYELRLRSLLSEIWALVLERAQPLMECGPASHPTHRDLRFEKMRDFVHAHYSEPVVTKAIEAKNMKDLPKLVEVLRTIAKADPSLNIEINNETGEHLMSGMGELHLEITEYRIINEQGVDIISSPPIVVYQESVRGANPAPFEGKSPNKHNKFYFIVEPLEEAIKDAIRKGDIDVEAKIKDQKALAKTLSDLGMDKEEAKGVVAFKNNNILLDCTKGIQYLHETMELIKQSFEEAMSKGPLANEKVAGVKIKLMDAKLHEDTIHRGPAQVIPAVRDGIYGAMCGAGRILLEPMQKVFISVPPDYMGGAVNLINQRRGTILEMGQDGADSTVSAECPVAEMFGFASDIRGSTQGRAIWSTENAGFKQLPPELQKKVVTEIRTRKGLNPEPYDEKYYSGM